MKKTLFILLTVLAPALLHAQSLIPDKRGPFDISGDSTLTVNLQFNYAGQTRVGYAGYNQVVVLCDSLNDDGTFSASGTSDIEGKPRYKLSYVVSDSANTLTWYTSQNDSTAIATNVTWSVGVFDFDYAVPEADGQAIEFNFDAGDTLRVYVWSYYASDR